MEAATATWRLWIISRQAASLVLTANSQTGTSTRERKCCVPLCSIALLCGANYPSQTLTDVLVVSLRKLLRQLWSDHPQTELRTR